MYREKIEALKEWKDSPYRKPLIIEGARQVGKTWLMKEFGRTCYKNTVYINFDNNEKMDRLFSGSLDISRIIMGLEIYSGQKITSEDTLIIFDEVQETPRALTSLKYFYENSPEYHIVCAGSLLGIALHPGTSFPVGKVDFLRLYPLSFKEFLLALGYDNMVSMLNKADFQMMNIFSDEYIQQLRYYYYIGGMPEAVSVFVETKDFKHVRDIQHSIIHAYENDFSKHAPTDITPKLRLVWNSIPSQLSKENKKFLYGVVREGARAKDYEVAIMWLTDCGLLHKVSRVNSPGIPLTAYEDLKAFKLFTLDVGILGAMSGLDVQILLEGNKLFSEFKGALTEQYVLQQLKSTTYYGVYYHTNDRASCEIDFILNAGRNSIPLEVKAEENLRAKSLRSYCEKYKPEIAVRTSMSAYRKEEWLTNIPLYAISEIAQISL